MFILIFWLRLFNYMNCKLFWDKEQYWSFQQQIKSSKKKLYWLCRNVMSIFHCVLIVEYYYSRETRRQMYDIRIRYFIWWWLSFRTNVYNSILYIIMLVEYEYENIIYEPSKRTPNESIIMCRVACVLISLIYNCTYFITLYA